MAHSATASEHELLETIARDYRNQGYEVLVEPGAATVPDFLREFRPDVVALSPNDKVVIEVKRTSKALSAAYLEHLAKTVSQHSGWRLQLVVGDSFDSAHVSLNEKIPGAGQIKDRLTRAKSLISNDEYELAIMLVAATIEATLRLVARRQEFGRVRAQVGTALLNMARANGLVAQKEFETFKQVLLVRNKIAHGLLTHRIDQRTVINAIRYCHRYLSE